ncbi:MAG TPA: glycosyltransferase family 2 protein [Mucilaginibacter sp.]|nr:glycosyltransferase family 2 protein [Mucilaginibacter sp.]
MLNTWTHRMATLGLVTVLYKSDGFLEDFFRSLSIQTYTDYHLYLIDNSSSPATEELVKRLAKQYAIPAYTHVQNDGNYGVAKGNNLGIKPALEAGCDYVLLLNNDIEFVNPKLFEEMMDRAVNHGEDVIIPKIMFFGTRVIQSAGGIFINYKGVSHSVGYKHPDGEPYNEPGYHEYAPTCFMLVSKNVFEKVGIMDEKYFVYFDDNDFTYRVSRAGFRLYFMPQLEIFHKVSMSTGGYETYFSVYHINRNRLYFIRKNFTFPMKQFALSWALATKSLQYFTSYKGERRKALAKALKDGLKMKPIEQEKQHAK